MADEGAKKPYTKEQVVNNIANGWFKCHFDLTKGASAVYDVIQKVHYREQDGGKQIKNWFFCSRCKDVINHDASMGTAPLKRHKEKRCDALSDDQKQKYAEEDLKKQKSILEKKQKDATDRAAASTSNVKNTEPTNGGPSKQPEETEAKTVTKVLVSTNNLSPQTAKVPKQDAFIQTKPQKIDQALLSTAEKGTQTKSPKSDDAQYILVAKICEIASKYGPVGVSDLKKANVQVKADP